LSRSGKSTQPVSFVVCLSNVGYTASLEIRKLYVALPDEEAERVGMLRVIDESGEDYLYPASNFARIDLPAADGGAR
jgi:hypothetical protein